MTDQEIFDTVCRAVIKQGRPSTGTDPFTGRFACRYRDKNGCKCAIGHLIPDEEYDESIEGNAVGHFLSEWNPVHEVLTRIGLLEGSKAEQTHRLQLLSSLQTCHDFAAIQAVEAAIQAVEMGGDFLYTFKRKAVNVARRFDLTPDVLEEA